MKETFKIMTGDIILGVLITIVVMLIVVKERDGKENK
tara:strand:+ start:444 stop:554 length:111 start_codon:yes stop_codon:yes gene_type:complete